MRALWVHRRRLMEDCIWCLVLLAACAAPRSPAILPESTSTDTPVPTLSAPTAVSIPSVEVSYECGFVYLARAWIDANANGVWDLSPREAALSGVTFHITLGDQESGVGAPAVSDGDGLAHPEIVWGGTKPCSVLQRELESEQSILIYPEVPVGYRLTSAFRQEVQTCDLSCDFGFVLDADTSTPPARP